MSLDTGHIFLDEMENQRGRIPRREKNQHRGLRTSWHAGQAGKFMIESLARVPVEVDYASEWRYRDPIVSL